MTHQTENDSVRQPSGGARLPHSVIVRAPGLLPMWYTPGELEHDLCVPARTVRDWLNKGLPHQRDGRGHIWIDGRQLAAWVASVRQSRSTQRLDADEAFCVTCRRPVKWLNPTRGSRGKLWLLNGTCPDCGKPIFRGVSRGQSTQLSTGG